MAFVAGIAGTKVIDFKNRPPLIIQAAEVLRRARKLPAGPARPFSVTSTRITAPTPGRNPRKRPDRGRADEALWPFERICGSCVSLKKTLGILPCPIQTNASNSPCRYWNAAASYGEWVGMKSSLRVCRKRWHGWSNCFARSTNKAASVGGLIHTWPNLRCRLLALSCPAR
jgi:hypothetical protein